MMQSNGGNDVAYLSRPICLLLILAGVLTLGVGVYQALRAPAKKA